MSNSRSRADHTAAEGLDALYAVADRVVGWAADGEQVEAVVAHSRYNEVRAYEGAVEELSSAETLGLGVRVVRDGRQGFAYAGTLDDDVLGETLAEARDNATFGTPDEHLGLARPDGVEPATLDLYRSDLVAVDPQVRVELALALERAVKAADARISGVRSSSYADTVGRAVVVTNTGIRAGSAETGAYVSASVLATYGSTTETGFGYSVGRHPEDLDVDIAAADAARRATRMLGATKPASGRFTIVLDPYVTASLLGIIGGTLSGEAVLKGRSLFADRLGEQVASPLLTLVDDPTDPRAYTATATDGEGLATRRNELIRGGELQRFLHNAYTARRAGTTSTGSAIRGFKSTPGVGAQALSLVPGTATQDELVAEVGEGILIQSVSGLHSGVNPVSGDFSTGAEGLRISGGEVGEPIREFTIASTLQRMLLDVAAVGGDLEWLPSSATGVSLVIGDIAVSGS